MQIISNVASVHKTSAYVTLCKSISSSALPSGDACTPLFDNGYVATTPKQERQPEGEGFITGIVSTENDVIHVTGILVSDCYGSCRSILSDFNLYRGSLEEVLPSRTLMKLT